MSIKIIIKGEAISNSDNLSELDGIDCQDNFSEYFDNDFSFKNDVSDGYMYFSYENGKLWTITEYFSNRELSDNELEILAEYTQGQWSDGIGEGFEQFPCYQTDDDKEVFVSPWFYGQILETKQTTI